MDSVDLEHGGDPLSPRPPRVFYEDEAVTLWHGDCRDLLPVVADVLVMDPPYGYSHASNRADSAWKDRRIAGDDSLALRDLVLEWWGDRPAAVFGSCKMPAPARVRATLVWDKGLASGMGDLSVPWKPNWEHIYVLGDGWAGRRDSGVLSGYNVVTWASRGRAHPNEKPVALLRDIIGKAPPGVILDPFAGSGSTLRAAKDLGRRAIGVELDEEWCREAASRLRQEVLGLSA